MLWKISKWLGLLLELVQYFVKTKWYIVCQLAHNYLFSNTFNCSISEVLIRTESISAAIRKSKGDIGHPCFTPLFTTNQGEVPLDKNIELVVL